MPKEKIDVQTNITDYTVMMILCLHIYIVLGNIRIEMYLKYDYHGIAAK